MELSLKSAKAKASFLAVCLFFVGPFELLSLRQFLADRQYSRLTVPGMQAALQLDPWNSEYAHVLGRMYLYQEQDFTAARTAISKAISLNPHNARYWLDLANIDQVTGDEGAEEIDLERARADEPTMPEISWEIGNLDLVRGDLPDAFRNFAAVEEYSPMLRKQTLELSWRVQPDVDVLMQYVPHNVESLSSLLEVLYERRQLGLAAKVWQNLTALRQPLNPDYVSNYLSELLSPAGPQVEQAQKVWSDFLAINPEMADYTSSGNLAMNGGFEHDVLGWGFDWRYGKRPHVSVAQENGIFHDGSRSLSVSFDGEDIPDFGIFQYVPVKPNTRYVLRAFIRADNIVGSSGPRLAVTAPYNFSQRYYTSDDILGSALWAEQGGSFTTGSDTHMVAIALLRNPPFDPLKGHLWLDDVSLTLEEGQ